jgi:hypothetical protein
MTNIYSLFPVRREGTLFRDHNPIDFFISRLSKSNSCERRVRFKKRSESTSESYLQEDQEPHAGVRAHKVSLEYQYRTIRTLFV